MHLFRSILNAHFLRYITLVVVACFTFCAQLSVQYVKTDIQNTDIAATSTTRTTFNIGSTAFAADPVDPSKPEAPKASDLTLISVLNTAIGLVSLIYVPFSMLSSWLLSPDWTFGDFIHLRPVLHSLWIFVSNTVYVVFAAMLIVVAIANIFGQSDSYAIKKMLPRFIIGVIMVPFTWWVVSASLSVSSYLTALVLRMPADIILQNSSLNTAKVKMTEHCTLNFNVDKNDTKIWHCDDPKEPGIDLAEYFLQSDGAYGIIPMYAYNIFKFNQLDEFKKTLNEPETEKAAVDLINANPKDQAAYAAGDNATKSAMLQAAIIATSIGKIGIQLMMSVIFAVVFVVILIALVLVLFTRVIKMWMYAIFSPLFALRYFLGDKIDKDNALAKFDFKEFIGLAMVPVVVSAALGFGFMFIMTFKGHMEQATTAKTGIESDYIKVTDNVANSGSIKFFGTTIDIKMSEINSNGVGANGQSVKADNLKAALFNVLSGLITPIFGIVILWMAVMAAIKTSAVAGKAVEGIEGLGKLAGDMGKKIPGMLPVPGASYTDKNGDKKSVNLKQLTMAPGLIKGWADAKESEERQGMQQWMGLDKSIQNLAAQIANLDHQKASKLYGESLSGKNIDQLITNETERGNLKAMLSKFNIDLPEAEMTQLNSGNKSAFAKAFKELVKKMQNDPRLDTTQKTKLRALNTNLTDNTITQAHLNEFSTIMGGGDSDSGGNTGPTHKDIDIHFDNNTFKNTKKITVSNAQTGGTPTDVILGSNLTNRSSLDEIKADIKSKLNAENIHMDEAELIKLANRIKTELPPPATP